jgi:chaperonin GroEL
MLAWNVIQEEDEWYGYNLKTEMFANMKQEGIIDPAKVTRLALENAASVAGTILLTECVVVDEPLKEKPQNEGGGVDFTMYQ